jgi:hypothetical protein
MKLSVNGELVTARLALWPALEFETTSGECGVIGPGEPLDLLRAAGVELVQATQRERAWLQRHAIELPEKSRDRRDTRPCADFA